MSNTRRPAGTIPAAFSRTGEDVPPSADVAAHNMAQLIGQATAFYLAELLGPVLEPRKQYTCIVCTARLKREAKEYETAVANAVAAAEPLPEAPSARIPEAITDGARGPVCWGCFDREKDGPYDMAEYLPASVD